MGVFDLLRIFNPSHCSGALLGLGRHVPESLCFDRIIITSVEAHGDTVN